jgi:hypothetical protein
MADITARRDQNRIPALMGVNSVTGELMHLQVNSLGELLTTLV